MIRTVPQKAPLNPWDDPGYASTINAPMGGSDTGGGSVPAPGRLGQPTNPPTPTPIEGGSFAPRRMSVPSGRPADANPTSVNVSSAPGSGITGPPAPTVLPDGGGGSVPVPPASMAPEGVVPPASTFNAENNLINSQINPGADPRLSKLQGYQDTALDKMFNGPDRNAMALDQYKTWEADTAPDYEHAITDATDAAAAHGQIRSGQLTNRYGDLSRQRALDLTTARNRYMQNALEGSIGDIRANYSAAADAEAQANSEGRSARNETRGERDYQRSLAEQAIARRIAQNQAETGTALTQYQAGNNLPDPTGALAEGAGLAGAESAQGSQDIGALIRAWLARNQSAAA
jgi:hypothetical protein